ncbi:hypothetical protein EYF80_036148 [Liparis tanakae]|uniref:Uncharacterized protein n=1 Tax=Liparis tanakae TaxID=230148 RepID=A0A4Z2GK69_9TELE|nr:hypothetical protein EYF80_036148 [Liparis tanakae]
MVVFLGARRSPGDTVKAHIVIGLRLLHPPSLAAREARPALLLFMPSKRLHWLVTCCVRWSLRNVALNCSHRGAEGSAVCKIARGGGAEGQGRGPGPGAGAGAMEAEGHCIWDL